MTPDEIRSVTFEKGMRGYHCDDVDEFLQQAALALESAEKQRNDALAEVEAGKQKMMVLAQKIEEYRDEEETLKTAMINAQRMGENIIREAKQKAESILREANIKAEDREQHAIDEIKEQQEKLETMQNEVSRFKAEVLGLYKKHIELLSALPGEEPVEEAASAIEEEQKTAETSLDLQESEDETASTYIPVEAQENPLEQPILTQEADSAADFTAEDVPEPEAEPQDTAEEVAFHIPTELPVPEDNEHEKPKPLTFDSFRGISFDD